MEVVNLNDLRDEGDWDVERPPLRMLHLGRRIDGELIGATVFEAEADAPGAYHFHHANEEWLLVLEGTPTIQWPEGERELRPGDTVAFRRGEDGAHAISNRSSHVARWVVLSTMNHPDVVEYPDAGVVGAISGGAPTAGRDAPFEAFFQSDAAVKYAEAYRRSLRR